MPILLSEIMKMIDERKRKKNNKGRKKGMTEAIVKVWELNDFVMLLS